MLTWTPRSNSDRLTVRLMRPSETPGGGFLGGDQSRLRKGQPKVRQAVGGLRNSGRFRLAAYGCPPQRRHRFDRHFDPPTEVGYTDIDALILEMDYSSNRILEPNEVDALIFAENSPGHGRWRTASLSSSHWLRFDRACVRANADAGSVILCRIIPRRSGRRYGTVSPRRYARARYSPHPQDQLSCARHAVFCHSCVREVHRTERRLHKLIALRR